VAQIPNHVGELSKITTLSIHMHQSKNQQQLEKLKEIFSSRNGTDSNTAENRGGEINHVQIHEVQLENRHADGSAVVSSSSTLSTVELGADMCHGDHVYEEEFRDCDGDALSMSRRDCRQETQDTPAALCEDCSALSPHENENSNRPLKRSSEMVGVACVYVHLDLALPCTSSPCSHSHSTFLFLFKFPRLVSQTISVKWTSTSVTAVPPLDCRLFLPRGLLFIVMVTIDIRTWEWDSRGTSLTGSTRVK